MPLSRRQFLQLAGIALLSSQFPVMPVPSFTNASGRTLRATPLRAHPQMSDPIVSHLWPDSIITILSVQDHWYLTEAGYVPKADVQPVLLKPAIQPVVATQVPFWAEVTAPVATVRQWCAADAPPVTRVGCGGIMQVTDTLAGTPDWYGVADESGRLIGWSQAVFWQPIVYTTQDFPLEIVVQPLAQQMTIRSHDTVLLEGQISCGQPIPAGTYLVERHPAGGMRADPYYGAPWPLRFGDQWNIVGAYWHNQFGSANPGPAIQTSTFLARWLYEHCGPGSRVVVADEL